MLVMAYLAAMEMLVFAEIQVMALGDLVILRNKANTRVPSALLAMMVGLAPVVVEVVAVHHPTLV